MAHREEMMRELSAMASCPPAPKDILVVVHDQPDCLKACLESVFAHTRDYTAYVWDNGSGEQTLGYLLDLARAGQIVLLRSYDNRGFIAPNNRLYALGSSPYVVLLNSDTEVQAGWAEAMVGWLRARPDLGIVGYQGGKLNSRAEGGRPGSGEDVDYVCGWGACVTRVAVDRAGGLFDERNLEFAYGEDSDLCLRLRERGLGAYALHLELVRHHGNRTIAAVHAELGERVRETFRRNHEYLRRRWAHRLRPVGDSQNPLSAIE